MKHAQTLQQEGIKKALQFVRIANILFNKISKNNHIFTLEVNQQ